MLIKIVNLFGTINGEEKKTLLYRSPILKKNS